MDCVLFTRFRATEHLSLYPFDSPLLDCFLNIPTSLIAFTRSHALRLSTDRGLNP